MKRRDGDMAIRSFRGVFNTGGVRIFRLGEWRLPLPYGLPMSTAAYFAGAWVAVQLAAKLPLMGALVGIHPAVKFVLFPLAIAMVLARVRVDGRPLHLTARSMLRARLEPRRLVGLERRELDAGEATVGEVGFWPDERAARYRPGRVVGPARVLLRYPLAAQQHGEDLLVRPLAGGPTQRGKRVRLQAGQRLIFEPRADKR